MTLTERVHVTRRYQRAIRIDADLGDPVALEGFVCPQSSAKALETMAHHVLETRQCAFTWTGPYGGGKSSLAVVLGAMLSASGHSRREAAALLGERTSSLLLEALPPRNRGWIVLPVSGRRERPAQVIGEAIATAGLLKGDKEPSNWSEKHVLDALEATAARNPRASGGLAVFIDELGKFLEGAARDGTDIHLFQQLAELASRSDGRLLVVGILHQAFEEYAHRLSREARDEWSKIQGRFVDLPINADGNEQIDLLARAIETDHRSGFLSALSEKVSGLVQGRTHPDLARMLEDCWPLHPVTACLLGPLSRRRFSQNQRSLFGFLNSAEPCGFRDFLGNASVTDLYAPDRLWDYLHLNLEPSILVSPDGHRWALAAEALGRCEAMGGSELHLRILKTIALADLLKDRSRLPASQALVDLALNDHGAESVCQAMKDLRNWSLVAFRKFADAWKIFEGSDFDIDLAVEQAIQDAVGTEAQALEDLASFQPMVAKRHYHKTGAMRWFDVGVVAVAQLEHFVRHYKPCHGAVGCFMLAVPTQGETETKARRFCKKAVKIGDNHDVIIGLSPVVWSIPGLAVELSALDHVRENHPELQGDRVARTEVAARIGAVRERIASDLARAFDSASWYRKDTRAKTLSRAELNSLASDLANERFCEAPRLHNELLSRAKPSASAIAARNALLRRMVLNECDERLEIVGFPAEGGLYVSLLESTDLHRKTTDGWRFISPDSRAGDPCFIEPLWSAARELFCNNSNRSVPISELYEIWKAPPYGIKDGLLPVLAVAFMLSEREKLAFYREDVFRTTLSDFDAEIVARNPELIRVRWVDLSGIPRDLLMELMSVVRDMDPEMQHRGFEPIDVARSLVALHDNLSPWVGRTQKLSRNAILVRQILKQANDPNRLIFDDLLKLCKGGIDKNENSIARLVANSVREGLDEMRNAYPDMLDRIRQNLLAELRVPKEDPTAISDLRNRAANIRDLGGDYRLEAFIVRLEKFEGSDTNIEDLAGMAVNKPVYGWTDLEVDRAMLELADMAQRFIRAEAFAHVKGRRNKRHAVAVVIGIEGHPIPLFDEFHVSESERFSVKSLVEKFHGMLDSSGESRRNVLLAALAEVSAQYLDDAKFFDYSRLDKTMHRKT